MKGYGLLSKKEIIENRFQAKIPDGLNYSPHYNLKCEGNCMVLTSANPMKFVSLWHGMVPFWSKEERVLYEAPIEGHVLSHDVDHTKRGIILSQDFRKPIRQQRGILPVDYFILTSEKGEPHVVFRTDKKRPLGIGIVWDAWKKNILDDLTYGFAIITVPAMVGFSNLGLGRMPLILSQYSWRKWLKPDSALMEITGCLDPFPEDLLNGYPVSDAILTSTENDKLLVKPVGKMIVKGPVVEIIQEKTIEGVPLTSAGRKAMKWHR
jgi:putative SOS response-associated peptidase YedK